MKPSTYRPGDDERYDRRRDPIDVDRPLARTAYDRAFSPPTPAQIALDQERTRRSHYPPPSPPAARARVVSDASYDEDRRYSTASREYYAYDRERAHGLDDDLYKRRLTLSERFDRDLLPPSRATWDERDRSPPRSVFDTAPRPLSARLSDNYGVPPSVDDRYIDRRFDAPPSVRGSPPPYTGRVRPRSPSPLGRRVGEPPEKRRREDVLLSEYLGRRAEYAPPPPPSRGYYDAPGAGVETGYDYERAAYRVRSPSRPATSYASASYRADPRDDRRYAPR